MLGMVVHAYNCCSWETEASLGYNMRAHHTTTPPKTYKETTNSYEKTEQTQIEQFSLVNNHKKVVTVSWSHSFFLVLFDFFPLSSVPISAGRFFNPFIFLVCSLLRSCFCIWILPKVVPKVSWETFFLFFGYKIREKNTHTHTHIYAYICDFSVTFYYITYTQKTELSVQSVLVFPS